MKSLRQKKIKDIIENSIIETQEELAQALRDHHINVTQATVSRDIKELMLIKLPTDDGRYRYACPADKKFFFSKNRMEQVFHDSVTHIDASENIIVIRTLPGAANAVASRLDYAKWPEIIGTLAGDDSILVVIKPISAVVTVMDRLKKFIS